MTITCEIREDTNPRKKLLIDSKPEWEVSVGVNEGGARNGK